MHRTWSQYVVGIIVLSLMGVSLSACSSTPNQSSKIQAIGVEAQYANVISQLGGQYVRVSSIINNPNTDPHTFEASTSVAREVSQATLIVQNGLGYDAFMNNIEHASPSSSRHVITVQSVAHIANTETNPHFWYSLSIMEQTARAITRALRTLQPEHATYFARRLNAFSSSLSTVDAAISTFRSAHHSVKVAVTEPVADYLLTAMRIKISTPFVFQADIMNGVDPAPQDISLEESLLTNNTVNLLCYNEQVVDQLTSTLKALAVTHHVPVVAVYEIMPLPGYTYQSWMLAEIHAISNAVTTKASTTSL